METKKVITEPMRGFMQRYMSTKGSKFFEHKDKLFAVLGMDRSLFSLKIEVIYSCGGQSLHPLIINIDDDMSLFLTKSPSPSNIELRCV